jgi:hypothetical protein
MLNALRIASSRSYASSSDFCRIFDEDLDEMYQLSFLLTGNHENAKQCFVSGLENSVKENRVFREWARSWARRTIIQCAVRIISPRPMQEDSPSSSNRSDNTPALERPEIAAILELRPFDRFVYVMSVLERYSDQDCSVLLGYPRADIVAARLRALQQTGSAAELTLSSI